MDESLNDLLPLLPPLEEMQKHSEYLKTLAERLKFKLYISDAEIQAIAWSVLNGTYQACKCNCKGKVPDYHDEVSRPTLDDVKALADRVNKYLAEPKEVRIAKYKAWFEKGLYGNG